MHTQLENPGLNESCIKKESLHQNQILDTARRTVAHEVQGTLCTPQSIVNALHATCETLGMEEIISSMEPFWIPLVKRIKKERERDIRRYDVASTEFQAEILRKHIAGSTAELVGQLAMAKTLKTDALKSTWEALTGKNGLIVPMHNGYWRFTGTYNVEFYETEQWAKTERRTMGEADFACTHTKNGTDTDYLVLIDFCMPQPLQKKAEGDARGLSKILNMASGIDVPAQKLHIMLSDKERSRATCESLRAHWSDVPHSYITRIPLRELASKIIAGVDRAFKNDDYSFSGLRHSLENPGNGNG